MHILGAYVYIHTKYEVSKFQVRIVKYLMCICSGYACIFIPNIEFLSSFLWQRGWCTDADVGTNANTETDTDTDDADIADDNYAKCVHSHVLKTKTLH